MGRRRELRRLFFVSAAGSFLRKCAHSKSSLEKELSAEG